MAQVQNVNISLKLAKKKYCLKLRLAVLWTLDVKYTRHVWISFYRLSVYILYFIQNDNGDFADYSSNAPEVYMSPDNIGRGQGYYSDLGTSKTMKITNIRR